MSAPKKGADVKPHIVCFRLTAAEKELLDAARGGMSPGEWARRFVIKGIQPTAGALIIPDSMEFDMNSLEGYSNPPRVLHFSDDEAQDLLKGQRHTLEERIIRGEEGQ